MTPPTILHLIHTLDPTQGGPPEVVRQLALATKGAQGRLEIVCQDIDSAEYLKSFPCVVHAIGRGHGTFSYSKNLLPWLRDNIARFDGLVIHGIWQYLGLAGAEAARNRVPYAVFV